jgi:hypothetical protein
VNPNLKVGENEKRNEPEAEAGDKEMKVLLSSPGVVVNSLPSIFGTLVHMASAKWIRPEYFSLNLTNV